MTQAERENHPTELTDEILATTIKHLSIRRENFYQSLAMHDEGTPRWRHFDEEISRLTAALTYHEDVRDDRVRPAS